MTRNHPTRPRYIRYPRWGGRRRALLPGFPVVRRWWVCWVVALQQPSMQLVHRSFATGFPPALPFFRSPSRPLKLFTPLVGVGGPEVDTLDATADSSGVVDPWDGGFVDAAGASGRFGHFGTLAAAAPHFSSGPMSSSKASSSHAAWLPVSTGDRSGERLSTGLDVPAAEDGDLLSNILDIF